MTEVKLVQAIRTLGGRRTQPFGNTSRMKNMKALEPMQGAFGQRVQADRAVFKFCFGFRFRFQLNFLHRIENFHVIVGAVRHKAD